MEIKKLVNDEKYIIVPDTNVLLNLYRYSPDFSEFGLQCLTEVVESLYLPATVRLEFGKHCKASFAAMEKKIENIGQGTEKQVKSARAKILSSCDQLKRLQFEGVDDLYRELAALLDELEVATKEFFEERKGLQLSSHYWNGSDKVMELVQKVEQYGHVLPSPSQEEIFKWCEEGQDRYKKEIPPGFKDAKNKDGVRKYGDLIIWKELLKFAREHKKDIILITDDVKADWWETDNDQRVFHPMLINEFKKTGRNIIAFESQEFYTAISDEYGVKQSDTVELALRMTDDDYCTYIRDDVFESIENDLVYHGTDYIDIQNSHVGTEGIDEYEIDSWEFESSERSSRDADKVIYLFKYHVNLLGSSYDYWGRDDDTKEIILGNETNHIFSGTITIEVEREANIFIDFEDSNDFYDSRIVESNIKETFYENVFDTSVYGEYGNCPDCGVPLDDENAGGNGFCIDCAENH